MDAGGGDTEKQGAVCLVTQPCPTLCNPMDCSPPGSSVHGIPRQGCWSGLPCPPPGDLPNPGIEPRSPALQAGSLLSEPAGKPEAGWEEHYSNDQKEGDSGAAPNSP